MYESDTYLMILEVGEKLGARECILIVGEERWGAPGDSVKDQVNSITDLERLKRMHRRAVKAANWQEILDSP
jgi:hypothetical protein